MFWRIYVTASLIYDYENCVLITLEDIAQRFDSKLTNSNGHL